MDISSSLVFVQTFFVSAVVPESAFNPQWEKKENIAL